MFLQPTHSEEAVQRVFVIRAYGEKKSGDEMDSLLLFYIGVEGMGGVS